MANLCRKVSHLKQLFCIKHIPCRCSNTLAGDALQHHRKSKLSNTRQIEKREALPSAPPDFRYVYPDFLPNPYWGSRDSVAEKLERQDMLRRRTKIEIPEFYVGSIMAVTASDVNAAERQNRFLGICIQRGGHGLRSYFILRNVIEGQGIEIMYEMYNPTIQKVEVLKLEKRLDEDLMYLRDAYEEYSTVPMDFSPVPHPPGGTVPVNEIKVKLKPRPWVRKWERENLQGVQELDIPQKYIDRWEKHQLNQPWEKYDLMKRYRERIPDEEAEPIMEEVYQHQVAMEKIRGKKKVIAIERLIKEKKLKKKK